MDFWQIITNIAKSPKMLLIVSPILLTSSIVCSESAVGQMSD